MSPAFNPFVGSAPPGNPQFTGGALPQSSGDGAEGVIGAVSFANPGDKGTPTALASIVILSVGVIIAAHLLGVRAGVGASIKLGGK